MAGASGTRVSTGAGSYGQLQASRRHPCVRMHACLHMGRQLQALDGQAGCRYHVQASAQRKGLTCVPSPAVSSGKSRRAVSARPSVLLTAGLPPMNAHACLPQTAEGGVVSDAQGSGQAGRLTPCDACGTRSGRHVKVTWTTTSRKATWFRLASRQKCALLSGTYQRSVDPAAQQNRGAVGPTGR
jgi:hypothetical protein